jgi:ADP-heptose:LPS heptosyltransferase
LLRRLAIPGVTLYSLQREAATEELTQTGVRDISTPDIVALGHLLCQLDLVICVDTMVAHLAGGLGCEAWVLLHADCDWRWPSSGCRSLWYPSLRLFHQKTTGNWSAVILEVREALKRRAKVGQSIRLARPRL